MTTTEFLQREYAVTYAGLTSNIPDMPTSVAVPAIAVEFLNNMASLPGNLIDQAKDFLDSSGLLIVDLLNYARRIIAEVKFPKKLTLAKQCVSALLARVQRLIDLPLRIAEPFVDLTRSLLNVVQLLANTPINLWNLLSNQLDIVFFGDLIKPIIQAIPNIGPFPGYSTDPPADLNVAEIITPYINLMIGTFTAPLQAIKALLDPFKPIWNFVKSMLKLNPMKIIKAIGKIPSVFSGLMAFLRNIANALSEPPTSLFRLLEPFLERLIRSLGAPNVPNGMIDKISDFFPQFMRMITGMVRGDNIQSLFFNGPDSIVARLGPVAGFLIQIYTFAKGTVMGAIKYLLGPILEIIGLSTDVPLNADGVSAGQCTCVPANPEPENLSLIESFLGKGFGQFYDKMTISNHWGLIDRQDRTDELREYEFTTQEIGSI